ncbi:centrosomal protein of 162 kDa [Genypterus blacodes]|uniref:centrosomal protein of 162 kDa n=1 Tax=Genypterus blacodes TaxID=154954 RepID=UPI003F75F5B3
MPLRLTREELDEQLQRFLNESLSDDSVDLGGIQKADDVMQGTTKPSQKSAQKGTVSTVPWWDDDDPGDRGAEGGLLGSKKTFRKSLRKSQPIEEKHELDEEHSSLRMKTAMNVKDNKDPKGDVPYGPAIEMSLGLDTLEEQEEKSRFFAQMETEASSTIDYSKLNRELDSTSSILGTKLRKTEEAMDESNEVQSTAKVTATDGKSAGSLHYSEDFKEENSEEALKNSEMSAIFTKGQSYVQSGGSELEAIHEAYRQISHAEIVSEDHNHHHHYDLSLEEEGSNWLPSPPQHVQSLQPASTTESDLPTAEELMEPIRPEDDRVRFFTLQPSSVLQLGQDKIFSSLERTSPQSNSKQPGKNEINEVGELTRFRSSSPEPSNYDLTRTIRSEVQRLMQDSKEPFRGRQSGKAKKQQAVGASAVTHHSTSSVRKPTTTPVRGRDSGLSRAPAAAAAVVKSKSPVSQTLEYDPKPTKSNKKDDSKHTAESEVKVSSYLTASVQSKVSVLQQQRDNHKPQDAAETQDVRGPQELRLIQDLTKKNQVENSSLVEEMRVQLAQKDKELQLMQHHTEEVTSLRQQNYLLQSKLRSIEEHNQKRSGMESAASVSEEKLHLINKEIQEQNVLIRGYQQENEKLCQEMKNLKAQSKASEEAMFQENQRLGNKLTMAREKLNNPPRHKGNEGSMDPSQCTAELLAQICTIQRNEAKLSEEIHKLKQQNQALIINLQRMQEERDLANAQATSISDNQIEMRVQEEKHREEVAALKKKLQRCAEKNQLLDKDSTRLKAASAEIHQLKEQVKKFKMSVGRRDAEQQKKTKEKAMDNAKMQNLEQQVKKLELILRQRNPNSLPALIYAAATADRQVDMDAAGTSPLNQLLEQRAKWLEAELEASDVKAKLRLQGLEQQYHMMKLRYEQRISELEQQFELGGSVAGAEPLLSQVQTLKEELHRVKKIQQSKEKSLQSQIESLQQQLNEKAWPSPVQNQPEAVQIDQLNQELTAKTHNIQELTCIVERLQMERKRSDTGSCQHSRSREDIGQPAPVDSRNQESGREETFPPTHHEKTYQPTRYTGSHITEVLEENEALRQHVDLLKVKSEQEKKALKANVQQTEEVLCRLKEDFAEQLSSMKAEHSKVLEHLRVTYALDHSSSKVAELVTKLNTQQIMIKHLQDKLKFQLQRPEEQNPEVKLLCTLERKILNLDLRHQQREEELQQVIVGSRQLLGSAQQSEVDHWKHLVQVKRRELETFYLELDSILDLIRQLHRQVILPS